MKLKNEYIFQKVGNVVMSVPRKGEFEGVVKNNSTADFIFRMLREETSEEAIVEAMLEKYDAPKEVIAAGVRDVLARLSEKGLLE